MQLEVGTLVRIVDDDEAICHALSLFLSGRGFKTVSYVSGRDFLESDDLSIPGCLILDVRMPETSGLEVQSTLINKRCRIPIIFLSAHGDIQMAVGAVQKGAMTFLEKPPQPQTLYNTVRQAITLSMQRERENRERENYLKQWNSLTNSERQAALIIAKGFKNPEVASVLEISLWTAKSYRTNVYQKLQCENPVEVADFLRIAQITDN